MEWVLDKLNQHDERSAFITDTETITYQQFLGKIEAWRTRLSLIDVKPGMVVALVGDYSPDLSALLTALIINRNIVLPLTADTQHEHQRFLQLACADFAIHFTQNNCQYTVDKLAPKEPHPHVMKLREKGDPGLVLFTSGTSGKSKGAVLSVNRLFDKYRKSSADPKRALRSLVFLKLDHIGGLNTLFATLFNGGSVVSVGDRSAKSVCNAIGRYAIELLPTTPTFLNMLLMSGVYRDYDLSSLRIITYGTEPMPRSTLTALNRAFPATKIKQTYGLTELGILSTRSRNSNSDWIMIGGEGVETRVVDDILYVKASSAMLGYLNAESSFTEDGWYNTGDRVEVDGDYVRILGRDSEIINVGGEKVYPAEVESALLEMENVSDVLVHGKTSPITGQIVTARIFLNKPEEYKTLTRRIYEHCSKKLEPFKIPKLIQIAESELVGNRLKKARYIPNGT